MMALLEPANLREAEIYDGCILVGGWRLEASVIYEFITKSCSLGAGLQYYITDFDLGFGVINSQSKIMLSHTKYFRNAFPW